MVDDAVPIADLSPHSRGSRLSDFTKNNTTLLPAEEKLREACMRGETCVIGDGTKPNASTNENTIRASFLRYLILGGCEESPLHQRGVRLKGAFIQCHDNSEFGKCMDLESTNIMVDILLWQCAIDGCLVVQSAKAKNLTLSGSSIDGLEGDRLSLRGSLHIREKFRTTKIVRLIGATIDGSLDCSNGQFDGSDSSIRLDAIRITGSIFLNKDFQSHGTIHLPNAHIGGNILCDGGIFHNKDKAILANKATIDGNVILGAANAAGTFSFQSAIIGGDFSANGATLSAKPSLELRGAEIKGTFHWRDIKHAPGRLDLGGASAKTVNMDEASWQKPKSIKLNNFTYKSFDNLESGANSNYWKRFLEQQPNDDLGEKFRPRPYEQLAEVLHSMGYEEEARSIRIKRQQLHTNFMAKYDPDRFATRSDGRQHWRIIHWLTVFARRTLIGPLVDYGFRPGKAVLYLLMLILIGSGVYWKAARFGVMTPTHPLIFKEAIDRGDGKPPIINPQCAENWVYFPKEVEAECRASVPSEYSEFQSLIYAADVALPIVNLRMENDWAPRVVDTSGNRDWLGWWVRTFEWFLIIMGWVLSLLFASAVGGIIRR